jgi:hypothetical protein
VLSDFWSRNILVTRGGIGFIDLEESYWSNPWLPLWRLLHEADQALTPAGRARPVAMEAYVSEWADTIAPETMRRAGAQLPILGRLFSVLLVQRDLRAVQRDADQALPAWYLRRTFQPYVQALVDTVHEAAV